MKLESERDFEIFDFSKPCNYGLVFSRGNMGAGEPSVFIVDNPVESSILGFSNTSYMAPLWVQGDGQK